MKKIKLILLLLAVSIGVKAQQRFLTVPATGLLRITYNDSTSTSIPTGLLTYSTDGLPANTLRLLGGNVKITEALYTNYRINGATPASLSALIAWLVANAPPASGGGGGGGGAVTITPTAQTGTPSTITVGTSSTTVTASGNYRILIQNNSANDIWISIGGTATLAPPSLLIPKNGGSYLTDSAFKDTQAITAISTVSSPITIVKY